MYPNLYFLCQNLKSCWMELVWCESTLTGPVPIKDMQNSPSPSVLRPFSWKMQNMLETNKNQFSDFYFLGYSENSSKIGGFEYKIIFLQSILPQVICCPSPSRSPAEDRPQNPTCSKPVPTTCPVPTWINKVYISNKYKVFYTINISNSLAKY